VPPRFPDSLDAPSLPFLVLASRADTPFDVAVVESVCYCSIAEFVADNFYALRRGAAIREPRPDMLRKPSRDNTWTGL
jgi:hypothetical protein